MSDTAASTLYREPPQAFFDLAKRFEGFSAEARPDEGRYEIGYGHDLDAADPLLHETINEAKADQLLADDGALAARQLCAVLPSLTVQRLTNGQWAALIDFTFNLGIGRFRGSTLHRLIEAGDFASASAQFALWVHARAADGEVTLPGLVERRAAERALWDAAP